MKKFVAFITFTKHYTDAVTLPGTVQLYSGVCPHFEYQ